MIVGDLLRLEDLNLGLAWGTPDLLDRQVTGVTSTDLQDPARYLQPGELVLSGLVWLSPGAESADAALRFATSLRSARVAALLAGEGTHGSVPDSLVEACRTHGIPLLAVPASTSFRSVTDRIYLRLWGDLHGGSDRAGALPEGIRQELSAMLEADAPLVEVLGRAVARLGLPHCEVRTAGGRLIAGSEARPGAGGEAAEAGPETGSAAAPAAPGAAAEPSVTEPVGVRIGGPGDSPFDGWYLTPGRAPMLHALAELLTPLPARDRARSAALRAAADRLLELLAAPAGAADQADLADALAACGLPSGGPLATVTARIDRAPGAWAVDALSDALAELRSEAQSDVPSEAADRAPAAFAVGTDVRGDATAFTVGDPAELRALLPRLQARLGASQVLRIGVGPRTTPTLSALRAALVGARYALAAADPYADAAELDSLPGLLAGIPPEVTLAFHERLLAPLTANDQENNVSLLGTLATFLDHDCSWSRTARALHIHVNTVHYRIRRIEELTGRDLARLADQIDLRAALLCAPGN